MRASIDTHVRGERPTIDTIVEQIGRSPMPRPRKIPQGPSSITGAEPDCHQQRRLALTALSATCL